MDRLNWMSAGVFTELLALGQCLPGPTSTQVSFAIGAVKKGIPGGILSGILFQYPGAIVMTALGYAAYKGLNNPKGALAGMSHVRFAMFVCFFHRSEFQEVVFIV